MPASPNILFLFPDQWRYDWLGTNPRVPVRTPNLDRLASGGVSFRQAICPSPLCAPCRAALAAGREYDRCGVPSNGQNYPLEQTTFYTLLRDTPTPGAPEGYHVMGCGKFDLAKPLLDWGLDGMRLLREWGFSDGVDNEGKWDGIISGAQSPKGPYLKYLHDRDLAHLHVADFARRKQAGKAATFPTPLPDEAYCDNWLSDVGLALLRRAPRHKPWFLQVNFTGPHDPWDITESMERAARELHGFPPAIANENLSPEQNESVRQNYSAMVENIDRRIGEFLRLVEERGELDHTLVVFSSDHGEMLGDHAGWGKNTFYQSSVGVPLIVRGPDVTGGRVIEAPTAVLDLAATFLDFAGIPRPADWDARTLRPVLRGETDRIRDVVRSGLQNWRMTMDDRWKLVRRTNGEDLLFDRTADPDECHNVLPDHPEAAAALAEA